MLCLLAAGDLPLAAVGIEDLGSEPYSNVSSSACRMS